MAVAVPASTQQGVLTIDEADDLLELVGDNDEARTILIRAIRRSFGFPQDFLTREQELAARRIFEQELKPKALAAAGPGPDFDDVVRSITGM